MPENKQFSIAVHLLAGLGHGREDFTSSMLAQSVNTSPSFIRRVLAKLSKANLIETTTGKTGKTKLARDPASISLLEIYRAVGAPMAFAIHDYPTQMSCAVSCNIKGSLEKVLARTQASMEKGLAEMSLADVIADLSH
jgi:Rrf2 family protein